MQATPTTYYPIVPSHHQMDTDPSLMQLRYIQQMEETEKMEHIRHMQQQQQLQQQQQMHIQLQMQAMREQAAAGMALMSSIPTIAADEERDLRSSGKNKKNKKRKTDVQSLLNPTSLSPHLQSSSPLLKSVSTPMNIVPINTAVHPTGPVQPHHATTMMIPAAEPTPDLNVHSTSPLKSFNLPSALQHFIREKANMNTTSAVSTNALGIMEKIGLMRNNLIDNASSMEERAHLQQQIEEQKRRKEEEEKEKRKVVMRALRKMKKLNQKEQKKSDQDATPMKPSGLDENALKASPPRKKGRKPKSSPTSVTMPASNGSAVSLSHDESSMDSVSDHPVDPPSNANLKTSPIQIEQSNAGTGSPLKSKKKKSSNAKRQKRKKQMNEDDLASAALANLGANATTMESVVEPNEESQESPSSLSSSSNSLSSPPSSSLERMRVSTLVEDSNSNPPTETSAAATNNSTNVVAHPDDPMNISTPPMNRNPQNFANSPWSQLIHSATEEDDSSDSGVNQVPKLSARPYKEGVNGIRVNHLNINDIISSISRQPSNKINYCLNVIKPADRVNGAPGGAPTETAGTPVANAPAVQNSTSGSATTSSGGSSTGPATTPKIVVNVVHSNLLPPAPPTSSFKKNRSDFKSKKPKVESQNSATEEDHKKVRFLLGEDHSDNDSDSKCYRRRRKKHKPILVIKSDEEFEEQNAAGRTIIDNVNNATTPTIDNNKPLNIVDEKVAPMSQSDKKSDEELQQQQNSPSIATAAGTIVISSDQTSTVPINKPKGYLTVTSF